MSLVLRVNHLLTTGLARPSPVKQMPKRKPGKQRKRLSMRPEKRPQTIMEQYRHRELLKAEHNRKVWEAQRLQWQLLFEIEVLNQKAAQYSATGI